MIPFFTAGERAALKCSKADAIDLASTARLGRASRKTGIWSAQPVRKLFMRLELPIRYKRDSRSSRSRHESHFRAPQTLFQLAHGSSAWRLNSPGKLSSASRRLAERISGAMRFASAFRALCHALRACRHRDRRCRVIARTRNECVHSTPFRRSAAPDTLHVVANILTGVSISGVPPLRGDD